MTAARILAACRRRGLDHLVAAAVLAGVLAGPSAANLISDALHQVSTCVVRAVHQQQHAKEKSA